MIKLKSKLVFTVLCMVATLSLVAQSQKKDAKPDEKAKDGKNKPKPKPIPVYLGKSDYYTGKITKGVFDSLVKQGLTSRDSAGRVFKVTGFTFSYAERNLYEDSVGNPMILTDYLSEYCFGDTLTPFLKVNIPERSKVGDTLFVDQISLIAPEGYGANGRPIKLVIVK